METKTYWYDIEDGGAYELETSEPYDLDSLAEECFEDYWSNHDGWEIGTDNAVDCIIWDVNPEDNPDTKPIWEGVVYAEPSVTFWSREC